jgi:hypothetical protein
MKRRVVICRFCLCVLVSGAGLRLAAGCASDPNAKPTSRPANARERQDQAMKDPFGYSPNAGSTDISGGGLSDFDRQGFNRDMKNVLDP